MKNAILLAISILLLNLTSFAQQNYQLNTKNSKLEWTGKAAFSSYSLSGTINAKSGSLNVADNQIQSAEITINTKSIDASSKQLVQHLKSEDFFEVKTYPTAHFKLEKIIILNGQQTAKGWLTIKDKKAAFKCPVEIEISNDKVHFQGIAVIDRLTYGINYNSPSIFASLKDQAIADEFKLKFELVFE